MSGAGNRLRSFIERIERLEEEIKALNGDKSEVYKEARGEGFDVKTMRKVVAARKLDPSEREEADALFDLYMAELNGRADDEPRARAHARVENIEEFDAETGEITEQPDPCSSKVDGGQPLPSPEATATQKAAAQVPAVGREPLGADITVHSGQESVSAAQGGNEPASASGASATHSDDFTPPAFLNKKASPLRPHCLNPGDQCAGYGSKHCHVCLKAMAESEAA